MAARPPVSGGLAVVVLTCSPMGVEVAARLAGLPAVRSLTVVTTCAARRRQGLAEKARAILRYEGPPGIVRAALARARRGGTRDSLAEEVAARCPGAAHLHFDDLHAPTARVRLEALGADLGVVAGNYLLRPEVFTIPRLGCLNLHLGRAPEFRGSSPSFYEMLEGVPEVGITVHRVTASLDGGPVLAQELFPLELAPEGDPLAYLQRLLTETLIPNGARMMAAAVAGLAGGPVRERVQPAAGRRPRRRATWRLKRELRRRVRARRRERRAGGAGPVDISPGGAIC